MTLRLTLEGVYRFVGVKIDDALEEFSRIELWPPNNALIRQIKWTIACPRSLTIDELVSCYVNRTNV